MPLTKKSIISSQHFIFHRFLLAFNSKGTYNADLYFSALSIKLSAFCIRAERIKNIFKNVL